MKWLYHDEKGAHQQEDFAISPPERLDKRSFASFRFRPKGNFSGWYIMAWIMTGNTSNNGWKSGYNIFLFFLTLQCIALVMALKWTRNVIQSARQIRGLSICTFLHKYQPGEEALRKMQEYPSNILNVTNVIYMLTLQQDWRISTHWKMLIKLWTSWIISLRLILFLAKKQNKTANEKTTNKQASKNIKRLEIEEHFAAKSLPPDI